MNPYPKQDHIAASGGASEVLGEQIELAEPEMKILTDICEFCKGEVHGLLLRQRSYQGIE